MSDTKTARHDHVRIMMIEIALHDLLRELEAQRKARRKAGPGRLEIMTAAEMMAKGSAELRLEDICRSPMTWCCRKGIRELGKLLFGIVGSTDKMRDVLDRVAAETSIGYGIACSVIDHCWDGIGEGKDVWHC